MPRIRLLRLLSVFLLGIVLATTACEGDDYWETPHANASGPGRGGGGAAMSVFKDDRPECPTAWTGGTVPMWMKPENTKGDLKNPPAVPSGSVHFIPTSGLAAPGPITDIPEFHDCQKFITAESAYDSLYAIFASSYLDSLTTALRMEQFTWSSSNPAVATVSATGLVTGVAAGTATIVARAVADPTRTAAAGFTITPAAAPGPHPDVTIPGAVPNLRPGDIIQLRAKVSIVTASTIAAAEIYTYGRGYAPLGIGPDFSCLYLYFDAGEKLRARMVMVGNPGPSIEACRDAFDPTSPEGKDLDILMTDAKTENALPAVARWDFDKPNKQYSIGIKCGHYWCEVGTKGASGAFARSAPLTVVAETPPDEARVLKGKGWYDQQELAMMADGKTLVPSGIVGTVIPSPDLVKFAKSDFDTGWVKTASIALDPSAAKPGAVEFYRKKFKIDPVMVTTGLGTLNKLYLCHGTRELCRIPDPHMGKSCGPDYKYNFFGIHLGPNKRVWTKIVNASGTDSLYRCNTRRYHGASMERYVAATTRWRWLTGDETVWDYCAVAGCCETAGDGF